MSATPHRRLSSRRGSTSALDPHALHANINENPNRTSSSTLTIVRVLPQQPSPSQPVALNEAPSSRRRRLGSSGAHSPPPTDTPPPGRLSFAFSSFGPNGGHSGSSSPATSPRLRPSSPRLLVAGCGPASLSLGKPRLTPGQLVDLARQATNPRTLAQIANSSVPSSPAPLSAHFGGLHSTGPSPVSRPQSLHLPDVSTNITPATFTPLPDDILLPFIDRPSEVAQVISTPPDVKLFALLSQTLPKVYAGEDTDPLNDPESVYIPKDPSLWTYAHLFHHLTQVDRDLAPDPIWAFAARQCILAHSESIWERVKGALGIPPELDIDYDFTRKRHRNSVQEKLNTKMRKLRMELREGAPKLRIGQGGSAADNESAIEDDDDSTETDISDDEGRATGHWSDWDATMESPAPVWQDSVHDVGGLVIGSFNDPPNVGISTEGPSPPLAATKVDSEESDFISIEALLAPSPETIGILNSNPPPPLSQAASHLLGTGAAADTPAAEGIGLGDIAEGEEDEDEAAVDGEDSSKKAVSNLSETKPEEEIIPPSHIQGLRILTSPVHAAGSYGVGGLYVPHHPHQPPGGHSGGGNTPPYSLSSPLPISPAVGDENRAEAGTLAQALASGHLVTSPPLGGRSHSRTSSFSSVTGVTIGPFSRSESTGTLATFLASQNQYHHHSGSEAGDSAGYASDRSGTAGGSVTSEIVGDRLPGQPLFVSNFARLNGCPTLKGSIAGRPAPSRFKLKRTGSTGGGVVGSIPSSSFLGSHAVGKLGDSEITRRERTYSHGSLPPT